jgi:hypothetical protein
MIQRILCELDEDKSGLKGALVRYGVLERIAASARGRDIRLLAFGIGMSEVRLVVEGVSADVSNLVRGLKVGTTSSARKWGFQVVWHPAFLRWEVPDDGLDEAVAWAHRAPVDEGANCPLSSPWSSHRDLMGFREASFFSVKPLRGRVTPAKVHLLAGGREIPVGFSLADRAKESLSRLLRVAASVLGVLPADRRCFRLFVHLAKARGWQTIEVAKALALTQRRIRQLASQSEPRLKLAMVSLSDPRLCHVP